VYRRLEYTERRVRLLDQTLAERNITVHGLSHLYMVYKEKVQGLLTSWAVQ
jgi:hypothetical protein